MRLNLIAWEKQNGFKAKCVAEKLGITEAQYSRIKSGKRDPSMIVVDRFFMVFGDTEGADDIYKLFVKSE